MLDMLTGSQNLARLDITLHNRTAKVNAKKVSAV